MTTPRLLTAEDVAEAIYTATHPNRSRPARVHFPVGRQTRVLAALTQVSPNWVQRRLNKIVSRS